MTYIKSLSLVCVAVALFYAAPGISGLECYECKDCDIFNETAASVCNFDPIVTTTSMPSTGTDGLTTTKVTTIKPETTTETKTTTKKPDENPDENPDEKPDEKPDENPDEKPDEKSNTREDSKNFCYKHEYKVGDKNYAERGCYTMKNNESPTDAKLCKTFAGIPTSAETENCLFCQNDDKCNSAGHIAVNMLLLLLPLSLIYLLRN